jgi:signal transduction histidine kinase
MTLLRVAQEALVNAAKHAPGRPVRLRLAYREDEEEMVLTAGNALGAADGRTAGSLSTADSGFGLAGMRERLLLAGGGLEAGVRGGEWVVEATLPCAASPVVTEGIRA